jgi:hypothetical protein
MSRKRKTEKNEVTKSVADSLGHATKEAKPPFPAALKNIIMISCRATRTAEGFATSDEIKVWVGIEKIEIGRPTKEIQQCSITLSFGLKATRKQEPKFDNPLLEINACYVLAFDLTSLEGVDDKSLLAFGAENGAFMAWPYWREFVHSMVGRLAMPLIVLPNLPVKDRAAPRS